MDLKVIRDEIARKRKSLDILCGEKRYFKRSELDKLEREKYIQRWGDKLKPNNKLLLEQSEVDKKDTDSSTKIEKPNTTVLTLDEVKRTFRLRNQPVRLFGESDSDVFERFTYVELNEPEWRGQRNDFKEAMDQIDRRYLDDLLNDECIKCVDNAVRKNKVQCAEPSMTYEDLAVIMTDRKSSDISESTLISTCFKIILKRWADYLNDRPDDQCRMVSDKIETVLFQQTCSYLNPLFRKLKAGTLPVDILDSLIDVVHSLFQRNYRRANEYFLELAIGNAPWPIGATNVGIHPRPGREKIASKHVAHVLNDETQRKYLQAVKRVITKAQVFYPGEPALSVEYQNIDANEDDY